MVILINEKTLKKILIEGVWCSQASTPMNVYIVDKGFPLQSEKAGRLVLSSIVKKRIGNKWIKVRSLIPQEGWIIRIDNIYTRIDASDTPSTLQAKAYGRTL